MQLWEIDSQLAKSHIPIASVAVYIRGWSLCPSKRVHVDVAAELEEFTPTEQNADQSTMHADAYDGYRCLLLKLVACKHT